MRLMFFMVFDGKIVFEDEKISLREVKIYFRKNREQTILWGKKHDESKKNLRLLEMIPYKNEKIVTFGSENDISTKNSTQINLVYPKNCSCFLLFFCFHISI